MKREENSLKSANYPSQRKVYFDILRIAAIFAVIVIHICAQGWGKADVGSAQWNVLSVYGSAVRWAVPIFVMVSGALLLGRDYSLEELYKGKILRIVTAFIFWSLLYALAVYFSGGDLKGILVNFVRGHYHMWFLFMITGLYMLVPFLRKIVQNEKLAKYFLFLSLIFTCIFNQAIYILGLASAHWASYARGIYNSIALFFVLGYPFYFVLGYILSKKSFSKKGALAALALGVISLIATVALTLFASNYFKTPIDSFFDIFSLNVVGESVCVFILAKKCFSGIKLSEKAGTIISSLAKYSFGAFLSHALIISAFNKLLQINVLSFNPIVSVPIMSIVVFVLSFAVSAVLNQIPVVKKYIV